MDSSRLSYQRAWVEGERPMEVLQDVLGYSIGRRVERRCNGAVLDGGVATKGFPCTRDKGAAELDGVEE
jgi:hypothetical protein